MHARAPPVHERHRPEQTVLYSIVKEHLAAFLRFAAEHYAAPLPKYVARAFHDFLRCGLLEFGFLRVHCESCRKDRLVAFSCRQRGVCPSCAARVMCNTAAHLTDRVLPNVPIRQWVLALPFELHLAAARDPKLLAACDRALIDAVFRWMRDQLGLARAKGGAVTAVQRFGSSINLHVHYHVLVLDGLFVRSRGGPPVFVGAPAPTANDLARVLADARAQIGKWLTKHASDVDLGDDALAGCAKLATQRGLFTDLGKGGAKDDEDPSTGKNRKSAVLDGFNLHAAVRIGADDDVAREKLARYCARPAFALDRLSVLSDGRIAYAIKNPRKGSTHRILTPIELLARIAALIPPPRHPFLRYHGVLAPASKWRKDIVPRVVEAARPDAQAGASPACHAEHGGHAHAAMPAGPAAPTQAPAPAPGSARAAKPDAHSPLWQRPSTSDAAAERDLRAITEAHLRRLDGGRLLATAPRLDWATLLKRTFQIDVFVCPRCHGPTRVIAAITEPAVIRKILGHLREPPARAPPSGAREPDDDLDTVDVWLDAEVDIGA
jgi:hypothetical protein